MAKELRWFKHYNRASEGESFELLIAERDFETAFIYWWLLEQVSKFEDRESAERRGRITLNSAFFKRKLGLNFNRTSRILTKIGKTFNLQIVVNFDESIEVFVPKWLELQENRGLKTFEKHSEKSLKKVQEERYRIKKESIDSESGDAPLHQLILIWNEYASNLGKVEKTNSARDKRTAAIWKCLNHLEWIKVVQRINASDFCKGTAKGSDGWVASYDWLLQKETYLKVLEGKYDNRKQASEFDKRFGSKSAEQKRTEREAEERAYQAQYTGRGPQEAAQSNPELAKILNRIIKVVPDQTK